MTTKNPKVTSYVRPVIYERLKEFSAKAEMTESKAIDAILGEYFGIEPPRVVTISRDDLPSDVTHRLATIVNDAIAPILQRLTALEGGVIPVGEKVA